MSPAENQRPVGRWAAIAVIGYLLATAGAAYAADSSDLRFLEGLRQRRLFDLAVDFCEQQLNSQTVSETDRATFAIELARSHVGQAMHASRRDREPLWQAATEVLGDFMRRYPNHPRRFLVRMQEALILLARGELTRQESEVGGDSAEALDEARQQVREAAGRLEELERDLQREIPGRVGTRQNSNELTSVELASLLDHVRYQLARAYRNQALAYPAASPDRVNALTQAIRRLDEVRKSVGAGDSLYWSCRLDLAVCNRLLEKPAVASQHLGELESQNPPRTVLLNVRAERARLALAAGEPDQALAALMQSHAAPGEPSPEFDFAHLETYVALWQTAQRKNDRDASAWREKAIAMTRRIEESHGPYWRRRADALLTGSIPADASSTEDLEILIRTARDHYLRKRFEEAVQAYDAAARRSLEANDTRQAFELFYKAAAIEHEQKRHAHAGQRFRELAVMLPTQAQAAQAHLLACFNLAQAARQDALLLDAYAEALEEHLRLWPETLDSARIWLGKLRESQERWKDAVAAYRGVPPTHPEYESAVVGAARSWPRYLSAMAADENRASAADEAARFFEAIVFEAGPAPPAGESPTFRAAAVAAAKIRLEHTPNGYPQAERVLRAALRAAASPPDEWRAEATGLLVVALAGQPAHVEEAKAMLRDAAGNSPQQRWQLIQSLASLVETSSPAIRPQLAQLTVQAFDLFGAQLQLSSTDQVASRRMRAEALAAAGRQTEALKAYEQLARQYPQDARIQEGYGELLLLSDNPADRPAALRQWRIISQGSRPRSERWWHAKYHVALLHFRGGDRAQAGQLIRYLQAVPPGLDDAPNKQDFLDLLQRCE